MSGEGSIFRRASDGAWIAQVSVGPRGNRRYISRSARSKSEARAKLADLRAGSAAPTRMTVGDFLERWVSDARDIRPTTRSGYRAVVTYHLQPTIGRVRLSDLSPLHVEGLLSDLSPSMSPKHLRNVHGTLRRALGQALRAGLVSRNVASREYVDAPKVPDAEPEAMTEAQVDALLTVDSPIRRLILVAVDTGLRMGELLGLAWEDVGPHELHVRKELVRNVGRYERSEPKTPRSKRRVPLTVRAVDALQEQRAHLGAEGFAPIATGPVFVNRDGGALNGSWVTHRFYGVCDAAGLDRRPFKILRATFSSRLHAAGVDDRTIADLMGHTRTRTTHGHYIATTYEQSQAAIGRLSQSPNQSHDRGAASRAEAR